MTLMNIIGWLISERTILFFIVVFSFYFFKSNQNITKSKLKMWLGIVSLVYIFFVGILPLLL